MCYLNVCIYTVYMSHSIVGFVIFPEFYVDSKKENLRNPAGQAPKSTMEGVISYQRLMTYGMFCLGMLFIIYYVHVSRYLCAKSLFLCLHFGHYFFYYVTNVDIHSPQKEIMTFIRFQAQIDLYRY